MENIRKYERLRLPSGLHLTVAKHTVSGVHPQHWHSYFEIEIILAGSGKYIINDVEYDISQNAVFLLTSTDFHYLETDEDTHLLNISFDSEMLSDGDMAALVSGHTKKAYVFESEEYERLINAARILQHECETAGECQKEMLFYIVKCLLKKNAVQPEGIKNQEHNRGIRKAIVYMEMHFAEKITLETVAAVAGYNAAYFSDLFSRLTGETYIEALSRIRLGHAKSMLAGGFSVSDACFMSGFGSLSNFLEIFKKHYKLSPHEYKKRAAHLSSFKGS